MLEELGECGIFSLAPRLDSRITTAPGLGDGGPFSVLKVSFMSDSFVLSFSLGFEYVILPNVHLLNL